jgi:hypothetical protein
MPSCVSVHIALNLALFFIPNKMDSKKKLKFISADPDLYLVFWPNFFNALM